MTAGLLILRPQPGAEETATRAAGRGLPATVAPLFVVRPISWDVPDPARFDAVIATSANALRHGGAGLASFTGLPLYAVGRATAGAARGAGFATVHAGDADAAALSARIAADGVGQALHLAGRDHHPIGGDSIETRIVYASDQMAMLPDAATAALVANAVVLIHSPRAGALFRRLAVGAGFAPAAIAIAAISPAALAACAGGWKATAAAAAPNDDALLDAATRLCDQGGGRGD